MIEQIRGKGVELIAVCAQPQEPVDQFMKDLNLEFTVSTNTMYSVYNH